MLDRLKARLRYYRETAEWKLEYLWYCRIRRKHWYKFGPRACIRCGKPFP